MKKIKVLFFINTLTGGGAEKALLDIVNNINKDRFEVTVQTIFNEGPYIEMLNDNILYKTIIKSPNTKIGIFLKKLLVKYVQNTKCTLLYKLFVKKNYDIEIAFLEGMPTKIIGCKLNKKVKKIAWVHTDMYNNFEAQCFFKKISNHRNAYLNYNKIICVSEDAKKQFLKRFEFDLNNNIEVQYNLLDKDDIIRKAKEKVEEINFSKFSLNICSVGRLVYAKGYDRLIKGIKKLLEEGYKINLYILGDGELRSELNKYIETNNLGEQIHLLGFKENPYKYIEKCDVVISSSRYEGFSLFINESLFIGKVILATKCAGPVELLRNGELGLIMENSENGIYEGIKKILEDKELYNYYLNNVKEFSKLYNKEERICEIEQKIMNYERRKI